MVLLFYSLPRSIEIPVFDGNSVDPDQTPRSGSTLFAKVHFTGR